MLDGGGCLDSLRCVFWLQYSCNTGFIRSLEECCATVRDHGENSKPSLPEVAVIPLARLIQVEDARHELGVYCGEYIREKFPGASSKVVADTWMLFTMVFSVKVPERWLISSQPLWLLSLVVSGKSTSYFVAFSKLVKMLV